MDIFFSSLYFSFAVDNVCQVFSSIELLPDIDGTCVDSSNFFLAVVNDHLKAFLQVFISNVQSQVS